MIQHLTYPDDFMSQQETFISSVVSLADDPLMKAIVVNQAIPGTTEAFKRVGPRGPTSCCSPASRTRTRSSSRAAPTWRPRRTSSSRGYTIIWAAKQLGAKTFVHISFPRHMSYESLGRRRAIMEAGLQGPRPEVRLRDRSRPDLRRRRGGRPAVHPREGPPVDPEVRQGQRLLLHQRRPHRAAAQAAARLRRDLRRGRPPVPAHGLPGRARASTCPRRRATSPPSSRRSSRPSWPRAARASSGPGPSATASPSAPGWASSPSA